MANYTVSKQQEKLNGRWKCQVTYHLPDVENCVSKKIVKFEEASEQELDDAVTRFIISITDNK